MFKIRCSSIGHVMAYADKPELPKGAETHLRNWSKSKLYGRSKEIGSKYLTKGNKVEDQAINLLAEYMGESFWFKNDQHFEDDHITGMPDVIRLDRVVEIKSPWDWSTFPAFESKIPESNYWWQCQGYMALTGKDFAQLCYVLCDTPEDQIYKEAKYRAYDLGCDIEDIIEDVEKSMTYGDIELSNRIKIFDIHRDEKAIENIRRRVEACRVFLGQLEF
jgi:hypothetical protein